MKSSLVFKLLTDYFNFLKKNYFPFLIFAYFLYLLFLIFRTTYFIDNVIYFSLFDDEMISMRYAKNLSEGNGLVWNIGERVEGFSNPLWTFYMVFWHLFKIPSNLISLFIQLTNVVFLILNLFYVKKIAQIIFKKNTLAVFISVIMTASYFSINNWAILGTETTPLMLISTTSIYLSIISIKSKKFSTLPYLIAGIGTLIRLDFFAFYLVLVIFNFILNKRHRLLISIFSFSFSFMGILMLLNFLPRIIYYGEFLPNTYYLKMTGFPILPRLVRGAYTLLNFLISSGMIFFIPSIYILKRNKYLTILPIFLVMQFLYSVYVGGDVWEYFGGANRYIAIIMPIYFLLVAGLSVFVMHKFKQSKLFLPFLLLIFGIHFLLLNTNGKDMARDWLGLSPHQIVGANKLNTQKAIVINEILKSSDTVAVEWAGVMPYFSNDKYYIDLLGKNDKYIARLDSSEFLRLSGKPFWDKFLPGHTKWDYNYSLLEKQPDIISQLPTNFNNLNFINDYSEIKIGEDRIFVKID